MFCAVIHLSIYLLVCLFVCLSSYLKMYNSQYNNSFVQYIQVYAFFVQVYAALLLQRCLFSPKHLQSQICVGVDYVLDGILGQRMKVEG